MKFTKNLITTTLILALFLNFISSETLTNKKSSLSKSSKNKLNSLSLSLLDLDHVPCKKCATSNEIQKDASQHFDCPNDKSAKCMFCVVGVDQSGCAKGCFRKAIKGAHSPCMVDKNYDPKKPYLPVAKPNLEAAKVIENSVKPQIQVEHKEPHIDVKNLNQDGNGLRGKFNTDNLNVVQLDKKRKF